MSRKAEFATPEKLPDFFAGLSVKTLANLRSQGKGPKYYKRFRRIFYRIEDVKNWIMEKE